MQLIVKKKGNTNQNHLILKLYVDKRLSQYTYYQITQDLVFSIFNFNVTEKTKTEACDFR